jgi:hypothetical protein
MDREEINRLIDQYRDAGTEFEQAIDELNETREERRRLGQAPSISEFMALHQRAHDACDRGMVAYRKLLDAGLSDREIVDRL